jgi:DNA-binding HxlR family transcriptional regulator
MTSIGSYGNFCGIARAFEIIGSTWSALLVRDLLLGAKTVEGLRESLPRLAEDELRARLDGLEGAGVVQRVAAESDGEAAFELTEYGKDLEPILLRMGRWGARALGDPRPGDVFSLDMAILALRATFRPEEARGVHATFEVWFGPLVVNVRVDDGALAVSEGELPDADLVISSPVLKHLMAAELGPTDALWLGLADTKGDPRLLTTFVTLFHIPPPPEQQPALGLSSGRTSVG